MLASTFFYLLAATCFLVFGSLSAICLNNRYGDSNAYAAGLLLTLSTAVTTFGCLYMATIMWGLENLRIFPGS